jgi:hypothetical protein
MMVPADSRSHAPAGQHRRAMSAQEGHRHPAAGSHDLARVHRLEITLRSYGPLTREGLYRLSGAEHWGDRGLQGGGPRTVAQRACA